MEIGLVRKVDIDHEMQQSYLDYAMSVIVSRALPDARDGLKPVQRRLLYAMYDMGIRPDSPYKKSARIVGEVLGKYHPHGDQAVYEAMARMAQDFSMRNALVDGQGNFGSVDGDPPAAMRYTEARITSFAMDMLAQIERNTINFDRNFDDTLDEPSVLPAAIPNLLVNGASGIAVGMATSIPPHNLGEIIDALIYLVENWEASDDVTVADLMKFVKGPDFPTGGIILQEHDQNEVQQAYATGRGKIMLRGRVNLEEAARGKSRIIVTELPYMTNKAALIERIADLSREGQLDAVTDLRDESDRHGMRIVIELKQGAEPEKTLLALYKKTPMQVTFTINLLALVNNEPRLMTLKQSLKVFVEHRLDVITRRSQYDLQKAQERLHLLEGLRIALKFLDEVIATIRGAKDTDDARGKLIKKFKLSEVQAQAILDMPLKRLAALERKKIEDEYKELSLTIKDLQTLLKSKKRLQQEVIVELQEIKQKYADRRRTQIVSLRSGESTSELLTVNDVMPVETVWIGMTPDGKVGQVRGESAPRLSGFEAPAILLKTDSHQTLYLVNAEGRAASIAVNIIPQVEKFSDGILYNKVCALPAEKIPVSLFSLAADAREDAAGVVLTLSREGLIKKSALSELPGVSAQAFALAKVNPGDALVSVSLAREDSELLIVTRKGMGIRFKGEEVRAMNLAAAGVNALKLAEGDLALDLVALTGGKEFLFVASDGMGWRMPEDAFPVQGRYGQGVIACRIKEGSQLTGLLYGKKNQAGTVFLKKAAPKSLRLDVIPEAKRGAAGKAVLEVKPGDEIYRTLTVAGATASAESSSDSISRKGKTPTKPKADDVKNTKARAAIEKELKPARNAAKAAARKSTSSAVKPTVKKKVDIKDAEPEEQKAVKKAAAKPSNVKKKTENSTSLAVKKTAIRKTDSTVKTTSKSKQPDAKKTPSSKQPAGAKKKPSAVNPQKATKDNSSKPPK
jgi:DNA gyrase subunit A